MRKRIVIIGPIPRDYIITHNGDLIQKWGGVAHPTIALSVLTEGRIDITPVVHVREVDHDNVREVFKGYKGIDLSAVTHENDQGDSITLKFVDQNNRIERQRGYMDPILPSDFKALLEADVFVFVPISDYQIPLDTIKHLKKKSKGLIIFDAHGPTTACLVGGERMRKFWIDRDLWLPYIDVLKMNMEEAKVSWFKKEYETTDFEEQELQENDMLAFAQHCLDMGVKCVYITMDSRGCMVYFKNRNKVESHFVESIKVDKVIDTTGCGDSFAGGIAYALLDKPKEYLHAAKFGNALGALRTQGKNFNVFRSLSDTLKIIEAGRV